MFKKKTSLPARPPIPSKEDILEDINRALADDVVFKYMQENPEVLTGEGVRESSCTSEKKENSDSAQKKEQFNDYVMVTKYVKKIENLIKYDEEIRIGRDGLKYLTKDLLTDMEKTKADLIKQLSTPEA